VRRTARVEEPKGASAYAATPKLREAVVSAPAASAAAPARAAVTPPPAPMTPPRAAVAPTPARASSASTPPVAASPLAAPAARGAASTVSLDAVKARWGAVADAVRAAGRGMLAESVRRVRPTALDASGLLTLTHDPGDDTFSTAVDNGRDAVLAALAELVGPVRALKLESEGPGFEAAPASRGKRITAQDVKSETIERLAQRDPLLAAAVDALDLELLDS
jgi:DNA polymerase III subunit gamma/tau